MTEETKPNWFKIISTFWPVLGGVAVILIFVIKAQSVSPSTFNELKDDFSKIKTKVAVLEQNIPDKKIMLQIHEGQAVMRTEIKQIKSLIEKYMDRKQKGGHGG